MMAFFNDAINRALEYPVDGGPVASVYVSQEKVRVGNREVWWSRAGLDVLRLPS